MLHFTITRQNDNTNKIAQQYEVIKNMAHLISFQVEYAVHGSQMNVLPWAIHQRRSPMSTTFKLCVLACIGEGMCVSVTFKVSIFAWVGGCVCGHACMQR